jgi:hypothetical protein
MATVSIGGQNYDLSTYAGRQAARDANPGMIVDASSAYNPNTGQQVTGGTGALQPFNAPPVTGDLTGLAQFAAQTSGVTDKQLAQQKAEFDAQLQLARDQMTQIGIPQLQIQQQLAALQQRFYEFQIAQATSGMTGFYQGQPTMQAFSQWAQLYGQNAPPTAGQQTLASLQQQFQQGIAAGQLTGTYQGQPTEAAREFNRQLALQQAQLGQQYLTTAAQLQGPQNTFQLSNYLRGAQGNPNVPTYLQSLAQNIGLPTFQAPGTTPPTAQTAGGLAGQLGGWQNATPGWDYAQTLGTMQGIANRGAQALGPGVLERLTPDELQAFGSGLGAVGGSLPTFLQQYAQSRATQGAPVTPPTFGG